MWLFVFQLVREHESPSWFYLTLVLYVFLSLANTGHMRTPRFFVLVSLPLPYVSFTRAYFRSPAPGFLPRRNTTTLFMSILPNIYLCSLLQSFLLRSENTLLCTYPVSEFSSPLINAQLSLVSLFRHCDTNSDGRSSDEGCDPWIDLIIMEQLKLLRKSNTV